MPSPPRGAAPLPDDPAPPAAAPAPPGRSASAPVLPRTDNAAAACRPVDLSTVCTPCREGRGVVVAMIPVHGHYQCPACGWRDSCCM